MKRAFAVIAAIFVASPHVFADAPDSSIKIDAGKVLNRVTPLMYGSCIEDVNHEIYGGLYSQLIFGESFEEPPREPTPGWLSFGGEWSVYDGVCSVKADAGAKLVRTEPTIGDGTVECDLRLDDDKGDNAGLILRVQRPRNGADVFVGYEVSLSARGGYLRLGRHRNDWKLIKDVPVHIKSGEWHHLKAELSGHDLRVFLDGAKSPAISYSDDQAAIDRGAVGLRTWQSNASFRRVVVDGGTKREADEFAPNESGGGVSGMWDPIATGISELPDPFAKPNDRAPNTEPPAPVKAIGRFTWDHDKPFNSMRSQKIEFLSGKGTIGIANRGLNRWGLNVDRGAYEGYIYLRQNGYDGDVTVALQSADGTHTYAQQRLGSITQKWRARKFTLHPQASDSKARFAIWIDKPGAVWVDQVYLSGTGDKLFHDLPIRGDIGRELQEEGLTVLRYGGTMVNADGYRWKKMIGDPDRRPQYKGWWYPYSTNGFGIEEFLQFCEAAKFEKVFAINVEETPRDAADLVEYLNGPETSEWGSRRAKNGHPAPYGVKYIEIGNEETTNEHYLERFKLLYDAMHARDPSVQFIIAAWWEPENPLSRRIVQELEGKAAMWDVHVGGDDLHEGRNVDALFTRMEKLVHEWAPKTSLKACVLEENGGRHDVQRALGHACVLNATERHGDFVLIDCPANCLQPWQQNDNDWDQGQVFFTSSQVWGMPPFYAQQMAAANHLPCRVASEIKSPNDELDVTSTRSDDASLLVLKVVNIGDKPHRANVEVSAFGAVDSRAEVSKLNGKLDAVVDPFKLNFESEDSWTAARGTVQVAAERFDYEFPADSYTILRLKRKP
jgi:alpha-L-arabinofuranosidase